MGNNLPSIKSLVTNSEISFTHYHDGNLWYSCRYDITYLDGCIDTWKEFDFPVPIDDIGNAVFKASDKPLLFMRYMRKQLKVLAEV